MDPDRQRLLAVAALGGLLVALLLLPGQPGRLTGTDAIGVYEITRSLREDGDLVVPPHIHAYRGRGGRIYSQYAIGQPLLALPFYELGRTAARALPAPLTERLAGPPLSSRTFATGKRNVSGIHLTYGGSLEILAVSLYPLFATGVLAAVFLVAARRLGASLRAATVASLLLGTCTYVGAMSNHFLRHTTEAALLLAAFAAWSVWRREGGRRMLLLGSVLASAIPLVRLPGAIAGLPLGAYLIACAVERRVWERPRPEWLRDLAAVLLPLAVAIGVSLLLNYVRWGLWLESPMLVERSRISLPRPEALRGFLLSPGASLWVYSPLLLLLPLSVPTAWRRARLETLFLLGASVVSVLFYAGYVFWTGLWSAPGPRFLMPVVPLLMLPLALWLDGAGRTARVAVGALGALGFLIQQALITTDFERLAWQQGYPRWKPLERFLFEADQSPALRSVEAFLAGELWDPWLLKIARGWPGVDPHPQLALALLVLWALVAAGTAALLWRRLAARPAAPPGSP